MTERKTTTYVLGARSLVGGPLARCLSGRGERVVAVTRTALPGDVTDVQWASLSDALSSAVPHSHWVSLMPIWHLVEYLDQLAARDCRRLIAVSSTSRYTKENAENDQDRSLAKRLASAEDAVLRWSAERKIECAIVRPTMIYGSTADANVSTLQAVMKRFRVMPLVGPAQGLRQPVHRDDLAGLIAAMSLRPQGPMRPDYNASGGEVLTYREMISRIRSQVRGPVATVPAPRGLFVVAQRFSKGSRWANLALGMAERMNVDMVFDHSELVSEYGYDPRGFHPGMGSD